MTALGSSRKTAAASSGGSSNIVKQRRRKGMQRNSRRMYGMASKRGSSVISRINKHHKHSGMAAWQQQQA